MYSLVEWMRVNKLTINLSKTEFIIIGSKPKLSGIVETTSISTADKEIYRSPYVNSPGFIIDHSIDWECHIQAVIKKFFLGFQS